MRWHKGAYACSPTYLVQQQVQGAIAHELCDYAEELRLIADTKDLDDVVEPGFVEDLRLLQQAVPLSEDKDQAYYRLNVFNWAGGQLRWLDKLGIFPIIE